MKRQLVTLFLIIGVTGAYLRAAEDPVHKTDIETGGRSLSFEKASPIFFPRNFVQVDSNVMGVPSATRGRSILGSLRVSDSVGGELEVFLSDRISLAVGAELKKKSPTGFTMADVGSQIWTSDYQFQFNASVFPVLGTMKFNIPYNDLRFYVGGGMGLYIGKIRMSWTSSELSPVGNDRIRASGVALIPHLNWGFDYKITQGLALGLDMRYVVDSFDSFTVKECADPEMIGQKLDFRGALNGTNAYPWAIKGLSVGLVLKLNFLP